MAKTKDKSPAGASKKRKADLDDSPESSTKKARHEQPTAFVKLPHSPGGSLHNPAQPEQDDSKVGKSARRRKNAGKKPDQQAQEAEDDSAAATTSATATAESASPTADRAVGPGAEEEGATAAQKRAAKKARAKAKGKRASPAPASHLGLEVGSQKADVESGTGEAVALLSQPPMDAGEVQEKQARREQKRARKAERRKTLQASAVQTSTVSSSKSGQVQNVPSLVKPEDADMTMTTFKSETAISGWSLSAPTAGRFIDQDPMFVRDPATQAEMLVTANDREVQVLSIETSLPVYSYPAEEGQVIKCLAAGPAGGSVHLAYGDGRVVEWDWTSDDPARKIEAPGSEITAMERTASSADVDEESFYLARQSGQSTIYHGMRSLHVSTPKLLSLQVLGEAEYIVAHSPATLILGMRKDRQHADSDFVFIELPMEKPITCVNARLANADRRDTKRRSALSLAVGNVEGQIHLYDDITSVFAQKGQAILPSPRILHWHREAVSAVKLSQDGNYLISGGKETVLVLWQLETGKKQFLPHLTSEIERIVVSPAGDKYAVQMGDNSIMVLSTSELKPVANFAGLQLAGPVRSHPSGLVITSQKKSVAAVLHPNNTSQLLVTVPATQPKSDTDAAEARPFLQTFDLRTSRHFTRQALTRNNVTDFNLGPEKTPVAPPDVALLAISHDGQWMATVDEWMPPASDLEHLVRDEGVQLAEERMKRREVYLKIWRWDEGQGLWTLSTRVDAPHARAAKGAQGAGKVFKLIADPTSTGFATIGEDSRAKTWKPKARVRHGVVLKGQDDVEVVEWTCRRTVELPTQVERADSPVDDTEPVAAAPASACLAYSEDGSMLAATQTFAGAGAVEQPLVHFIDTFTGAIQASKPVGLAPSQPESIGFLDRYFLAIADHTVHVWDLVTDSLRHRHNIPITGAPMLAVNSTEGTFAVAVGSRVSVYKPTGTQSVYKTHCGNDVTALLSGKGSRGYTLLFGDATVRTLSSMGAAAQMRAALPGADETTVADPQSSAGLVAGASAGDDDVEMADVLALSATKEEAQGLLLADAEDDRPVVRPEQLAKLFDVGQSFAMPPVKEMFEAVVGLFGRKPVHDVLESSNSSGMVGDVAVK
ncbi:hypothetical protein LTR36_008273 [Oleoguttula mirabilis]|uniref:WD40 repeat-like protein n=1 Tax=Oleoguttula mirabilis TaxID=1507867 RepID=A0AAV9J8X8_9PEZI|nr:hypothetical protein LTR36_008273 [Oleoguttula mirabilis]